MKFSILLMILSFNTCLIGQVIDQKKYKISGPNSTVIEAMIQAVNEKDAQKYVVDFAQKVQVYVDQELKVEGRDNLMSNRANHFKSHPQVRSEIQYLVEIDNKVIMHDKVWLTPESMDQDIVEIFTFEGGLVTRVDVIQPKTLFTSN